MHSSLFLMNRKEIVRTEMAPYSLFERGDQQWVTVKFEQPMVELKIHRINIVLLLVSGGILFLSFFLCVWEYRTWDWPGALASALGAIIVAPVLMKAILLLVAIFTSSPKNGEGE